MHWSRQYKGATVYVEIDFVVLNEAGDALLIEQKNGALEEGDDGLHKRYGEVRNSVADQILRAVANVKEKFGYQFGAAARLKVEYLIYCPDHALKLLNAAAIDLERVVDAKRAAELPARIQAALPPAKAAPGGQAQRVEAFFRQSFDLVPDIHAHIGAQEKNFIRNDRYGREVCAVFIGSRDAGLEQVRAGLSCGTTSDSSASRLRSSDPSSPTPSCARVRGAAACGRRRTRHRHGCGALDQPNRCLSPDYSSCGAGARLRAGWRSKAADGSTAPS